MEWLGWWPVFCQVVSRSSTESEPWAILIYDSLTRANSLVMTPRGDVTRSPKQVHQWLQLNLACVQPNLNNVFKRLPSTPTCPSLYHRIYMVFLNNACERGVTRSVHNDVCRIMLTSSFLSPSHFSHLSTTKKKKSYLKSIESALWLWKLQKYSLNINFPFHMGLLSGSVKLEQ